MSANPAGIIEREQFHPPEAESTCLQADIFAAGFQRTIVPDATAHIPRLQSNVAGERAVLSFPSYLPNSTDEEEEGSITGQGSIPINVQPTASPTLPPTDSEDAVYLSHPVEPLSSGFASPTRPEEEKPGRETFLCSSPLPSISSAFERSGSVAVEPSDSRSWPNDNVEMLTQPVEELAIGLEEIKDELLEESPIVEHLKRKTGTVSPSDEDLGDLSGAGNIFLSPTAEAAAEFVKAKRNLLKQPSYTLASTGMWQQHPPKSNILRARHVPRVTAARSPVPSLSYDTALEKNDSSNHESQPSPLPHYLSYKQRQHPPLPLSSHRSGQHERTFHQQHFDRDRHRPCDQSTRNPYPFSTAAAKLSGTSITPDSRIRDAYRTETLTSAIRPVARYRRDMVTAVLSNSSPHAEADDLVKSRRPMGHRTYVGSKRTHSSQKIDEISGKSSRPPFDRYSENDDYTEDDEDVRRALHRSLFGSNIPECLQGEREGIQELSPNVNIWRKDLSHSAHAKKIRRPSYWDGDLEEIKMSPAGRGGVVSSPIFNRRKTSSDLGHAITGTDSLAIDDENLLDEVEQAGEEFEYRMARYALENEKIRDIVDCAMTGME